MYQTLDPKKVKELFIIRRSWFDGAYELTDNANNSYGLMTYTNFFRRTAVAVTATRQWTFSRGEFLSRTLLITDADGLPVGKAKRELFSTKTTLTLETGFICEFSRPSIWSRCYVWEAPGCGKIMHIRGRLFSRTGKVYIDNNMAPESIVPLLIFFGTYMMILRRRRKAAH